MAQLTKDVASGLDYVAVGETQNPKHILVMLHGSGADYSDMENASKFFTKKLPADTVILIPNASHLFADILPPEQVEQLKNAGVDTGKMRSWFGTTDTEGMNQDDAMKAVAAKMQEETTKLNKFIKSKQDEYGLNDGATATYGFSQGGVLALQAGVDRTAPLAAVVSHSGYMLGFEIAYSQPRTLLIVGAKELENGQPMQEMHAETANFLREVLNVHVTEHVSAGLAHGLNLDTVNTATSFIKKAFDGPSAEVTKDLSATFAKFAGAEVPVRELFMDTPKGKEVVYVEILDRDSQLLLDFRKAALDAGFREASVLTPTSRVSTQTAADRLTAQVTKGPDGKYRLGDFKIG